MGAKVQLICARCHRRIKGAYSWHMGHPFGPVCSKLMDLEKKNTRTKKVVRDTQTLDLFDMEA